jgi:hypothetical protein
VAIDVFFGDFAEQVEQALAREFNFSAPVSGGQGAFYSDEVDWFGWAQLQQMVMAAIGRPGAPNLLSVEAWRGVFLPIAVEPAQLEIAEDAWLQCASLPGLIGELEALASAYSLPTDRAGLSALWDKYAEDEDADVGIEMQTYSQLMLAAQVAAERGLPLWVVK